MNIRANIAIILSGFVLASCTSLGFTPRQRPAAATMGGSSSNNSSKYASLESAGTASATVSANEQDATASDNRRGGSHKKHHANAEQGGRSHASSVSSQTGSTHQPGYSSQPGSTYSASSSGNTGYVASNTTSNAVGNYSDASNVLDNFIANEQNAATACDSASAILSSAAQSNLQHRWADALTLAGTAAASCSAMLEPSKEVAAVAATQMTEPQLKNYLVQASSPLSRGMAGYELMRLCVGNANTECYDQYRESIANDLLAVGMPVEAAELVQRGIETNKSSRPLVAVALPLSGRDKKMGRAMLGAFLQSAGIYAHNGLKWDFRIFDTQSDSSKLAGIVDEASRYGVKLMLGPLDVQEAQAASVAASQKDMVVLSFAPNDAFVSDRAFQLSYAMEPEMRVIANAVADENARRIVIAYPTGRYGDMMKSLLVKYVHSGVSVIPIEYSANATDLSREAKNIVAASPDAVVIPTDAKSAERLLSFVAQENMWCKKTGATTKTSKGDMRQWVSCIGTSSWAPITASSDFKFIKNARYLDYAYAVRGGTTFATTFERLYHRLPNVYEILPYDAVELINSIPVQNLQDSNALMQFLRREIGGQARILTPSLTEVAF